MMEKILIIKTSALGDIIHTYPSAEYLRKKFPKAQIDWVVESQNVDLIQSHPAIDRALTISTKDWREAPLHISTLLSIKKFRSKLRENSYDVAFDFQGNIKSGLILSQVRAKHKVGFASKNVPEWPNMLFTNHRFNSAGDGNIRHDYLSLVTSFFGESLPKLSSHTQLKLTDEKARILQKQAHHLLSGVGPKILVCAGSAWQNKQLTIEALLSFLLLIQKSFNATFLFVWGSIPEQSTAKALYSSFSNCSHVVDKMSLPMLQNLMSMCDLVIAMDSLPLHLAGTTKTPSYSVFGASLAKKYKPIGEQHAAFQGICPYGRTFEKRCPILRTCKTGACIRGLTGDEIFADFHAWWTHNSPRATEITEERRD